MASTGPQLGARGSSSESRAGSIQGKLNDNEISYNILGGKSHGPYQFSKKPQEMWGKGEWRYICRRKVLLNRSLTWKRHPLFYWALKLLSGLNLLKISRMYRKQSRIQLEPSECCTISRERMSLQPSVPRYAGVRRNKRG